MNEGIPGIRHSEIERLEFLLSDARRTGDKVDEKELEERIAELKAENDSVNFSLQDGSMPYSETKPLPPEETPQEILNRLKKLFSSDKSE